MNPKANAVHSTTLRKYTLPLLHKNIKTFVDDVLTTSLQDVQTVGFTSDFWKSRSNDMFFNLSIHYIDKSFVLHHYSLDFRPWSGRETGEAIALEMREVIEAVAGLETAVDRGNKSLVMVTDGAANMGKAARLCRTIDRHMLCVDHKLEICLKAAFENKDTVTYEEVWTAIDRAKGFAGRLHQSALSAGIIEEEAKRLKGKLFI